MTFSSSGGGVDIEARSALVTPRRLRPRTGDLQRLAEADADEPAQRLRGFPNRDNRGWQLEPGGPKLREPAVAL
jgi:hypothetical protein